MTTSTTSSQEELERYKKELLECAVKIVRFIRENELKNGELKLIPHTHVFGTFTILQSHIEMFRRAVVGINAFLEQKKYNYKVMYDLEGLLDHRIEVGWVSDNNSDVKIFTLNESQFVS